MATLWYVFLSSPTWAQNEVPPAEVPPARVAPGQSVADATRQSLARSFASLIQQAIPLEYEKKKDWDRRKNITVGLRSEGKGLHVKLRRRKKAVKHGVWKHYKIRLVQPEQSLAVRIDNLRALDGGRVGFTLMVTAKLDTWARAKVYQYGVHLIALEIVGDTDIELALDCEISMHFQTVEGTPGVAIDPRVGDARISLRNFHVRRVSQAKGPLVEELSDGLRKMIEHELKGPKLVAKLNRAIDKKRDRLELNVGQLWNSPWGPLAGLPDVERAVRAQ